MRTITIESTGSTNTALKELALGGELPEGTILIAGSQTAGRGQRGSSWEAEPGCNITCSILFYPEFLEPARFFLLSQVVSLGVKDTLDSLVNGITIKWPNDIYHGNRKIAGILIENELSGNRFSLSVAGIGLNVNQISFRSDAPNPVSIRQLTGRETDLDILSERLHYQIISRYEELKRGESAPIEEDYHRALYRNSGFHTYEEKSGRLFEAEIVGVAPDGLLRLRLRSGEIRDYAFKEVRFAAPSDSREAE